MGQLPARVAFLILLAAAIVLAPIVGPALPVPAIVWTCAPAALAIAIGAAWIRHPESDRETTVRFVVAGGVAINTLLVGWSVALFFSG